MKAQGGMTMAYSDYGGYAYRNGERIESRSDAVIKPDGDLFATPGMWPGFAADITTGTGENRETRVRWPSGHAVIGDGPIFAVFYKTIVMVYRGPERLATFDFGFDPTPEPVKHTYTVDGVTVDIVLQEEDNFYAYGRLTQPDGNVWHGWSGYGVGAGLEDVDYGYSTSERETTLWELFERPAAEESKR